jgi:hypothetical protein
MVRDLVKHFCGAIVKTQNRAIGSSLLTVGVVGALLCVTIAGVGIVVRGNH